MESINEIPGWLWWTTAVISGILSSYFKDALTFILSRFSKNISSRLEKLDKKQEEKLHVIKSSLNERILFSNSIVHSNQTIIIYLLVIVLLFIVVILTQVNELVNYSDPKIPRKLGIDKYSRIVGSISIVILLIAAFQLYIKNSLKILVLKNVLKKDISKNDNGNLD